MSLLNTRDYAGLINGRKKASVKQAAIDKEKNKYAMATWKSGNPKPQIFVPMASIGRMAEKGKDGEGKPTHALDFITRGQFLSRTLDDSWKTGGLGVSYRAYFWGIVFFALTALSYLYVHVYVAAVFAYFTGFMRSQYLINHAWNVEWFKGKALISSK